MRRLQSATLGAVFLALSASDGFATDLRIGTTVSQQFSGTSRYGTSNGGSDSFRSNTNVGLQFSGRQPLTVWSLNLGASLSGRSDSDDSFFSDVRPSINGSLARRGKRLNVDGSLSVVPRFVSDREFDSIFIEDVETGDIETIRVASDVDPLEITTNASLGLGYALNGGDNLSLNASVRRRDYDETTDSFQPNMTITLGGGWNTAVDPRTSAGITLRTRYFTSEDSDDSDSTAVTLSTRATRRFTPRHSLAATIGGTFTQDEDNSELFFTGGLNGAYSTPRTRFRAFLTQDVEQREDGDLELVLQTGLSASHRINSVSRVSIGSRLSSDVPLFSSSDRNDLTLGLTARYQLSLTEDWRMSVGASTRLSQDLDDSESRGTNRVFVTFSRAFDLLP